MYESIIENTRHQFIFAPSIAFFQATNGFYAYRIQNLTAFLVQIKPQKRWIVQLLFNIKSLPCTFESPSAGHFSVLPSTSENCVRSTAEAPVHSSAIGMLRWSATYIAAHTCPLYNKCFIRSVCLPQNRNMLSSRNSQPYYWHMMVASPSSPRRRSVYPQAT